LSGFDLKTDESAVTGETDLIKKSRTHPFLRSGTVIASGSGVMIIIAVGPNSQWGKALKMIAQGRDAVKDDKKENEEEEEEDPLFVKQLSKEEQDLKDQAESDQTPLEIKLADLAGDIGKLGVSAGALTTAVLTIGWLIRKVIDVNADRVEWSWADLSQIVHFIIIGVTIIVVAVPEGLPLAVTISLAYSVRKMLRDNNLVRHLAACETMGGATYICSDKTGTLTLNQMNVVQGYFGGRDYKDGVSQVHTTLHQNSYQLLVEGIVVNSKCTVMENDEKKEEKKQNEFLAKIQAPLQKIGIIDKPKEKKYNPEDRWKVVGSKTEGAMVLMLIKHFDKPLIWPEQTLKEYEASHKIAMQFPFSSKNKRMSTVLRLSHQFDPHSYSAVDERTAVVYDYRLYCKGASEIVLGLCNTYIHQNGSHVVIDEQKRRELGHIIESMANQGLRTLCLAYREFSKKYLPLDEEMSRAQSNTESSNETEEDPDSVVRASREPFEDGYVQDSRELMYFETHGVQEQLETDLTLVAILGIKDPVRDEVPNAVRTCRRAGIRVKMITGDNILTAKHIARECGILTDGIAIEGPEFRKLSDQQVKNILPNIQVMARSSPSDKHRLVTQLREMGEVVAVTGDGTNDGPALKAADVGLSMGISGTQVAKEASDIIILDDNFESIVQSVKWGRSVFENIRKFLQFQISVNIVALVLTIVTAVSTFIIGEKEPGSNVIKYNPPLTAIQLLWVNLIMDTFAALALATEPPSEEVLNRKPYGRKSRLISRKMWVMIWSQSIYQLVILLFIYYAGVPIGIHNRRFKHLDAAERKDEREHLNRSLVFNIFVVVQIFNQFNARKIHFELNIFSGIMNSWGFMTITAITMILQLAFILLPRASTVIERITQTKYLYWEDWLITIGFAFLSLLVAFVTRLIAKLILYLLGKHKDDIPDELDDVVEMDKSDKIAPIIDDIPIAENYTNNNRQNSFNEKITPAEIQEAVGPNQPRKMYDH
jgi:magnesium-transporting ATPase (P-type)